MHINERPTVPQTGIHDAAGNPLQTVREVDITSLVPVTSAAERVLMLYGWDPGLGPTLVFYRGIPGDHTVGDRRVSVLMWLLGDSGTTSLATVEELLRSGGSPFELAVLIYSQSPFDPSIVPLRIPATA